MDNLELPLLKPTDIESLSLKGLSNLRMPQSANAEVENLLLSDARAREAAFNAMAMKEAFAQSRESRRRGKAIAKAKDRAAQRIAEGR